jgi:YD repeat-containing protein
VPQVRFLNLGLGFSSHSSPDSTINGFTYDSRGRRTSATDQNGKITAYACDDADRLLTVTDAANNVTTHGYDTATNLTSIGREQQRRKAAYNKILAPSLATIKFTFR